MEKNTNFRAWTLVIGILVILALGVSIVVFAVWQSVQATRDTIRPVNELTSNVATQVAGYLNPTPTTIPDPVTIIRGVRSLARLETIQYSVEKIITAESGQGPFGFLFGDRLILVAHGVVIAGVDLELLGPEDLWVQDGVLNVRLPEAEIFIATLDNQQSYVYDRDVGVLTKGNVDLESSARRAAEVEIANAALEDGILEQAQRNAENYLYRLLLDLGYPEVIFATPKPVITP